MDHPSIELKRLLALSSLGVDYVESVRGLDLLAEIAARIAGTKVSVINLIDSFTQWRVAAVGIEAGQMPRKESICHYGLGAAREGDYEIPDMSKDERFRDKEYVSGEMGLRYYLGIPLVTAEGYEIGSLCVMDPTPKSLSLSSKSLLRVVAEAAAERLEAHKLICDLRYQAKESQKVNSKLAHDLKGPVSGLVGLANILKEHLDIYSPAEIREYAEMMANGGNATLELVESILGNKFSDFDDKICFKNDISLDELRERLLQLYMSQAMVKDIKLGVNIISNNSQARITKNRVLQILGNLVSNAIKFTSEGGWVEVSLELEESGLNYLLKAQVRDTGMGISPEKIREILSQTNGSESGSVGEQGYGIGLRLVQSLLCQAGGKMEILSEPGRGTVFVVQFCAA